MIYTCSGPMPTHQYAWIQPGAIGEHDWIKVAWFGVVAYPGRIWGCNVMLECGAIYRNVPLHHLAHRKTDVQWMPAKAQTWDCYGHQFSSLEYPYLIGRSARVRTRDKAEHVGRYLFTLIPVGDPWSSHPEQSKEFTLCALENGRYTCQPTNHVLFEDRSFVTSKEWPKWLRRQTEVYSVESVGSL